MLTNHAKYLSLSMCFTVLLVTVAAAQAPPTSSAPSQDVETGVQTAPVIVDGNHLFRLRGVSAYPAEKRAQVIADRIAGLAKDRNFSLENLQVAESPYGTQILNGNQLILNVFDDDARIEGAQRQTLGGAYLYRIRDAIQAYRHDRQPKLLIRHAIYAAAAIVAFFLFLYVGYRTSARIRSALEKRYKERIHGVGIQALQILHAKHLWNLLIGVLAFAAIALVFLAAYITLYYVLSLFPWTRGLSKDLSSFFLTPLSTMTVAFIRTLPDLIFIGVLALVTFYILKLIRLVFTAIESGAIELSNFDPTWSKPTYRLVRGLVIAFAVVVAFPYIPGSNTQAFKGLSLFVGLVFSLGSTSLIGNLISGYSLTYRRVFKPGDRVKIGDHQGVVQESKMMVTYIKTIKNELIAVPNSEIINKEVINYSSLAKTMGLILHTTVGIGYETPWRQVEAMLMESAARTPGLLREPSPFVRQKELGDFAVTYEINAYTDNPLGVDLVYTNLHRNILDVFNEYGIQIMTPAYEGDPEQAKVVPKESWYTAPARPELEQAKGSGTG